MITEQEQPDPVLHYLAHATRQQLLDELVVRNLATVVMFDCVVANAGVAEVKSICSYSGPLTQLYGLLSIHAPRIKNGIQMKMSQGYEMIERGGIEGS